MADIFGVLDNRTFNGTEMISNQRTALSKVTNLKKLANGDQGAS